MKIIADQEGILRRFIKEARNWDSHLSNTKQVIRDFVGEKHPDSLTVLGSGWMLDIPVDFLAGQVREIFFYDIRHPAGIIDRYRNYNNMKFIQADLTGGVIDAVYKLCQHKADTSIGAIEKILESARLVLPAKSDCVISVNLLNQLDILIIDYLKKKIDLSDNEIIRFREIIQSSHIDFLLKHCYCLITDTEEIHLNDAGQMVNKTPLIYTKLPERSKEKSWIWHFDTRQTYHDGCNTYMNVKALY